MSVLCFNRILVDLKVVVSDEQIVFDFILFDKNYILEIQIKLAQNNQPVIS